MLWTRSYVSFFYCLSDSLRTNARQVIHFWHLWATSEHSRSALKLYLASTQIEVKAQNTVEDINIRSNVVAENQISDTLF